MSHVYQSSPIRILREQKKLTLDELSKAIGIDKNVLLNYEFGFLQISQEHGTIISNYFGVDPSQIGLEKPTDKNFPNSFIDLIKPNKETKYKKEAQQFARSFKDSFKHKSREETLAELHNQLFHPSLMSPGTPFIFTKIIIVLALIFALSYAITEIALSSLSLSMLVPLSLLWYLYERHIPRSINGIEILRLFIFGGLTSIIFVLYVREFVGYPNIFFLTDLITAIVEETSKIVIVILLVKKIRIEHVMTGMLVGFAVGAGFDAFETVSYGMMDFFTNLNFSVMQEHIAVRSGYALIGLGHHFWTGILCGALVSINKTGYLQFKDMTHPIFFIWYLIVIGLHTFNNFIFSTFWPLIFLLAFISFALFISMWIKARHSFQQQSHEMKEDLQSS